MTIVIIIWILQAIFELASFYVEKRFALIMEGLRADGAHLVQPVVAVGGAIKKFITGKENSESEITKERALLDKIVSKKE